MKKEISKQKIDIVGEKESFSKLANIKPKLYTEDDMNKAFDLGFQWSKTDKSVAPFTYLWDKLKNK